MQPLVQLTILGEPASKANSRRLVRFGKRIASIKSAKATNYLAQLQSQVKHISPLLVEDLHLDIKIYYASRRPDLDESIILDGLQGLIYKNDRSVKSRFTRWGLDPKHPRAEVKIFLLADFLRHRARA